MEALIHFNYLYKSYVHSYIFGIKVIPAYVLLKKDIWSYKFLKTYFDLKMSFILIKQDSLMTSLTKTKKNTINTKIILC